MSQPPQRYVDFEELWKQSVDAALDVSSAGRAENDQTDPAVTGVQRSGGCWGTRVECGVRLGSQDEYDDTERVDGDLPVHFARHTSDTAAVCYHNLLQQGIRTLTFVEIVHVLGAWHEEKDLRLREANDSGAPTETEHDIIAKFVCRVLAVAVGSWSGHRPRFPFDLNCFLYDAPGVLKTQVQAVAEYSKVSVWTCLTSSPGAWVERSVKHSCPQDCIRKCLALH